MRRVVGLLAVVAVLVTGSTVAAAGAPVRAPEKSKPKSTTTTAPDNGCQHIVARSAKRSTQPPSDKVEFLKDAVATPTDCYDKITFTFDRGDGPNLPPGYLVEYRKDPFGLEGVSTSTASFAEAKAVLYVEFPLTSTSDTRFAGPIVDTYKGNLRLLLSGMNSTVIVEWVKELPDPTPAIHTDDRVVWLIGLSSKRPFTVDGANEPTPHVSILVMH